MVVVVPWRLVVVALVFSVWCLVVDAFGLLPWLLAPCRLGGVALVPRRIGVVVWMFGVLVFGELRLDVVALVIGALTHWRCFVCALAA